MKRIALNQEYAIVLQQIKEAGEEDFANLAESLRITRPRLVHIIENLQHKGLILVTRSTYADAWIRLSSKGQHFVAMAWPESRGFSPSAA